MNASKENEVMHLVSMHLEPRDQAMLSICSKTIREAVSRHEPLWWRLRLAYISTVEYIEARQQLHTGEWWVHFLEGEELEAVKPINHKTAIAHHLSLIDNYTSEDKDMFQYVHTQMKHVKGKDQRLDGKGIVVNHLLRGRVAEARVVIKQYELWRSRDMYYYPEYMLIDELVSIRLGKMARYLIPGDHKEEFMKYFCYHLDNDYDPFVKGYNRVIQRRDVIGESLASAIVNGSSKIANALVKEVHLPGCLCQLPTTLSHRVVHYPMFSANDFSNLPKLVCKDCMSEYIRDTSDWSPCF